MSAIGWFIAGFIARGFASGPSRPVERRALRPVWYGHWDDNPPFWRRAWREGWTFRLEPGASQLWTAGMHDVWVQLFVDNPEAEVERCLVQGERRTPFGLTIGAIEHPGDFGVYMRNVTDRPLDARVRMRVWTKRYYLA